MLGIHTERYLGRACKIYMRLYIKRIQVAFALNHLHRYALYQVIFVVLTRSHYYEIDSYCVVQSLLVNNVRYLEIVSAFERQRLDIVARCC